MKLLVLSDSHRNIRLMRQAVQQESPDAALHLGDHIDDALKLNLEFPDLVIYMVRGNCDYQSRGKDDLFFTLNGVNVFMTHGHNYGVKRGLDSLTERARQLGADIVLYGHTHRAMVRCDDGLRIMCPGQMERQDNFHTVSYGVVTIENGSVECELKRLELL